MKTVKSPAPPDPHLPFSIHPFPSSGLFLSTCGSLKILADTWSDKK